MNECTGQAKRRAWIYAGTDRSARLLFFKNNGCLAILFLDVCLAALRCFESIS